DGMNQYTDITGQGIHHDGNFNIWYLNGGYVTYDADKRITSVSVGGSEWMHFTYDGLGRCGRRMEMGATTLFTCDEWNKMVVGEAALRHEWPVCELVWEPFHVYGPGMDSRARHV